MDNNLHMNMEYYGQIVKLNEYVETYNIHIYPNDLFSVYRGEDPYSKTHSLSQHKFTDLTIKHATFRHFIVTCFSAYFFIFTFLIRHLYNMHPLFYMTQVVCLNWSYFTFFLNAFLLHFRLFFQRAVARGCTDTTPTSCVYLRT